MTAKDRNEHYGKLNARFDARMTEIHGYGFKRGEGNAYILKNCFGKLEVCSTTVMHADSVVWEDFISGVKLFIG